DLFGVHALGTSTDVTNSYLRVRHDISDADAAAVIAPLERTSVIINSANRVDVELRDDAARTVPLSLIDSFPDLPMEEVYRRDFDESTPQLVLSEYGNGRVAYFANDIDRAFSDYLVHDHFDLLRSVVEWGRNAP